MRIWVARAEVLDRYVQHMVEDCEHGCGTCLVCERHGSRIARDTAEIADSDEFDVSERAEVGVRQVLSKGADEEAGKRGKAGHAFWHVDRRLVVSFILDYTGDEGTVDSLGPRDAKGAHVALLELEIGVYSQDQPIGEAPRLLEEGFYVGGRVVVGVILEDGHAHLGSLGEDGAEPRLNPIVIFFFTASCRHDDVGAGG